MSAKSAAFISKGQAMQLRRIQVGQSMKRTENYYFIQNLFLGRRKNKCSGAISEEVGWQLGHPTML